MTISIKELGRLIVAKRGSQGVRAAAVAVGISSATLSRVERGNMPDLETFAKICKWIGRDPNEFLGFSSDKSSTIQAVVHFRKDKTVSHETAVALGDLIIKAQEALQARSNLAQ